MLIGGYIPAASVKGPDVVHVAPMRISSEPWAGPLTINKIVFMVPLHTHLGRRKCGRGPRIFGHRARARAALPPTPSLVNP